MMKTDWKLPPKAKIYEAMSAVADGRVKLVSGEQAAVQSSDLAKTYTVVWDASKESFGSNDNASYWVGYIGYPVIASLIELKRLDRNEEIIDLLAGVNWNYLNNVYKRDYNAAVDYVLGQIERNGGDANAIRTYAESLYAQLKSLRLGKINPPGEPPKRN